MRSGPEYFRLGRRELIVCEHARGMQLCEVFDLVGRVRRRGRILRLVLAAVSRCLVVGRRLVVVLLLPGPRGRVVSNRRSAHRTDNERPPPYTSPETHEELLPFHPAEVPLPVLGPARGQLRPGGRSPASPSMGETNDPQPGCQAARLCPGATPAVIHRSRSELHPRLIPDRSTPARRALTPGRTPVTSAATMLTCGHRSGTRRIRCTRSSRYTGR